MNIVQLNEYFTIHAWMLQLPLRGAVELLTYAIIYHGIPLRLSIEETIPYICEFANSRKYEVSVALQSLEKKKLVEVRQIKKDNQLYSVYKVKNLVRSTKTLKQ